MIRPVSGESIDELKVQKAYNNLGHVPPQNLSMSFDLLKSRDLAPYMDSEWVKNILIENENLNNGEISRKR